MRPAKHGDQRAPGPDPAARALAVPPRPVLALLTGLIVAGIVYFALVWDRPLPFYGLFHGNNDLVLHAAAFALLVLALGLLVRLRVAVPVAGAAALAIEAIQIWIPARNASLTDLAAGGLGIALGAALARWLRSSGRSSHTHGTGCGAGRIPR